MKLVLIIGCLFWFTACQSLSESKQTNDIPIFTCLSKFELSLDKRTWWKSATLDGQKEPPVQLKNLNKELNWLNYFAISAIDKDQFQFVTQNKENGNSINQWNRKVKGDGIQKLIIEQNQTGRCVQAAAIFEEKNVLFERKLNLNAQFKVKDTSAVFTIEGHQKILFLEPVNYLVSFYGLRPIEHF